MKQNNFLLALLLLLLAPGVMNATGLQENLVFTARMDGQQEVPSVNTTGRGLAAAILSPMHDTLCITASWVALTGPATSAHLHVGLPGQSGPPVITLTPFLSDSGTQLGALITGPDLTPQIIRDLIAGRYYINVHTDQFPDGEIRGQMTLEAEETFVARLNGQQETPPNGSAGRGLGVFHLSADDNILRFQIIVRDMTGMLVNAHLHKAAAGTAGPPVLDLMPFATGSFFNGAADSILVPGFSNFISDLQSGLIYVNVHTDTFPDGELRGQLLRERGVGFTAVPGPEQVNPPVTSSGGGLAYFSMSPGADTLRYEAILGGLSANTTSAHLRLGAPGVNGPIEVDLTLGVQGNTMIGTAADTTINHDLLRKMMRGDIYLNISNANNPNGEIRGQLVPSVRSVYTMLLNGSQVQPMVNGTGYGFGFISVDPLQNTARYSFLYGGLSGASTGVNFHTGAAGAVGPVLFTATPFVTNGNFGTGYWFANDTVNPLLPDLAQTLQDEQVYLNVQTAQNPSGEIRGQALNGLVCNRFDETTAVGDVKGMSSAMEVYPNPTEANGLVTVRYVSENTADAVIMVIDMLGKKVWEQRVKTTAGVNKFNLDLSTFSRGVYTVKLMAGRNNYSRSVSKQ